MSDGLIPAFAEPFTPEAITGVTAAGFGIDRAWAFDAADGTGVTVAVVDSGVDYSHPRVGGPAGPGIAMRWNREALEVVEEPGEHADLYGHGTACAAIIRRAAPEAAIVSIRVLGERLTGKGNVFARGLSWAVESGARVVNLSLSTGKREYFADFHEIADAAHFAGVVLVCAMNNVPAPVYPGQYASVISVAACAGDDPFLLYANPNPPADFGAPGIDVDVAWLDGGSIVATGNSFAAPHVAGLAARLLSKHPDLTPYEVKAVLRAVSANAV